MHLYSVHTLILTDLTPPMRIASYASVHMVLHYNVISAIYRRQVGIIFHRSASSTGMNGSSLGDIVCMDHYIIHHVYRTTQFICIPDISFIMSFISSKHNEVYNIN